MNLFQGVKMAWKSISMNKMRSFLTMLGIIIGVFAVIALVALGSGATNRISEEMQKLGTNLLSINITGRGAKASLSLSEVQAFTDIAHVQAVSPTLSGRVKAKNGSANSDVSIEGVTSDYETVRDYHVQEGRFLLPIDVDYRQKVALIGTETAKTLFGTADPVGQNVTLNGIRFKVVGLLASKGSSFGGNNDDKILIPITTAERLLATKGIKSVYVRAESQETIDLAIAGLEQALQKKFRGDDDEGYNIFNQQDALESANTITNTLSMALGGIAGISLLVGGIGIMNIMLVSVTERTREIGVRKALGAKKRDILLQFLVESVVLGGFGGILGIASGVGGATLLGKLLSIQASFSLNVIVISFVFSLGIGVFFGIYPANKAAKLHPIDALRT